MSVVRSRLVNGGRATQSRMSVSSRERANRKATNDAAPVSERTDRKRIRGPGGRHTRAGLDRREVCSKPLRALERAQYVGMA